MSAEALERLYVYGPLIGWTALVCTAIPFLVIATRVLKRVDEHAKTLNQSETERHPS